MHKVFIKFYMGFVIPKSLTILLRNEPNHFGDHQFQHMKNDTLYAVPFYEKTITLFLYPVSDLLGLALIVHGPYWYLMALIVILWVLYSVIRSLSVIEPQKTYP